MSSLQPLFTPEEYRLGKEIDALRDRSHGVTVAIPCYQQAEHLEKSLTSVVRQTVEAERIIVVDDGSPSQSPEIERISKIYGADYVRITNRGLPSARNTALMLAETFAFLPLDADDWIDLYYIEKTLPLLQEADVVLTGLQEHGPTRNLAYIPGYDRPHYEVDEGLMWQDNRFFYCALFRTDLLRRVGGYHPRMAGWPGVKGGYEDWDLWIDLLHRGTRFAAVNEPLLNYNTSNPNSMLMEAQNSREQLIMEMRRHHA